MQQFTIPSISGNSITFSASNESPLFVVGANGSGKSSLLHRLATTNQGKFKKISAHRQMWLESDELNITSASRKNFVRQYQQQDAQPESRFKDFNPQYRAGMIVYDLISGENQRARAIAAAVDNDANVKMAASSNPSPISLINTILAGSNLDIQVAVEGDDRLIARRDGQPVYGASALSDGERSALLLSASVLTERSGMTLAIDEPERHLHRSISAPLLKALFDLRSDIDFIVSTHDVVLPTFFPQSSVLLIRKCVYSGNNPLSWDADLMGGDLDIPDSLKESVLGSRRRIAFVEGDDRGLDRALYQRLVPNASVEARGSCESVRSAVSGLHGESQLHWIEARGIIDGDNRDGPEREKLKVSGIDTLSLYSVESLFYHPDVITRIAERSSAVTGESSTEMVERASEAILSAANRHSQRLAEKAGMQVSRRNIMERMGEAFDAGSSRIEFSFDMTESVTHFADLLQKALRERDIESLLRHFALRETEALAGASSALGFRSRSHYESAVLKAIDDDPGLGGQLRSIGGLTGEFWDQ